MVKHETVPQAPLPKKEIKVIQAFRKKWKRAAVCSLLILSAAAIGGGYTLSELLLFTGRSTKAAWMHPAPPTCTGWANDTGFRLDPDRADGATDSAANPSNLPWLLDCPSILTKAAHHRFTANLNGTAIHYVVFPTQPKSAAGSDSTGNSPASHAQQPLWVHFHGVNGNYLHGARYLAAAERLGFQLVSAELSNHGTSGYTGRGAAYGCSERFDVLAVLSDLLTLEPNRDILITASSMGTMALALAEKDLTRLDTGHHVIAYALENPISSVEEIVTESPAVPHFPSFLVQIGLAFAGMRSGHNFLSCKPLKSYGDFSRPVLVQHAETDGFAPVEMGRRVFAALPNALPKQLKVYPSGGHSAVWNSQPHAFESDLIEIWNLGLVYREELRGASKPWKTIEP
jgi:pimeloyl-ACP methyl ester carboxylesterase